MAQIKSITWTNPNPAVAKNLDFGFTPAEVTIVDLTNGGSKYWNSGFTDGSVLDVDAGTITGTNGVTPLAQSAILGAEISGFTNANPGVITASYINDVGIAAGDTIKVAGLADDDSASDSLNGQFTVASVSSTAITLNEDTSSYSAYVSGGYVTRVSDSNGDAIPQENVAINGVTLGTSAVGGNSASMVAIARGDNPVT